MSVEETNARQWVGELLPEELQKFREINTQNAALRNVMVNQMDVCEKRQLKINEQSREVWEGVGTRLNLDIFNSDFNLEVFPDGTGKVFAVPRQKAAA